MAHSTASSAACTQAAPLPHTHKNAQARPAWRTCVREQRRVELLLDGCTVHGGANEHNLLLNSDRQQQQQGQAGWGCDWQQGRQGRADSTRGVPTAGQSSGQQH